MSVWWIRLLGVTLLCAGTLVACSSKTAQGSLKATSSPTSVTASPTALALASLQGCDKPQVARSLPTLVKLPVKPDDIVFDANGDIWLSATDAGKILELSPAGNQLAIVNDPDGPEGIAPLPDGRIAVANQRSNSIVVFRPGVTGFSTLFTLVNHTANLGVDGIFFDSVSQRLLVPDSPNGRLFSVGVDGSSKLLVSTGLGRPVGVTTDATGTIYTASETLPGIATVSGTGAISRIATFTNLDEVVYLNGLLYTANRATESLDAVDPTTGNSVELVTGGSSLQGLVATPDGRSLLLVDELTNSVTIAQPCSQNG